MTEFLGLTPSQEQWDAMTMQERRDHKIAAAKMVYGVNVKCDKDGNPVADKDGNAICDSMPLNRNHLTALRQAEKDNPNFEQIMAAHTLIVEENERATAARRAR